MKHSLLLLLLLPAAVAGQEKPAGPVVPAQAPSRPSWSALRISKWATLAGTLGTAVYGVTTAREADNEYERLERSCQAAPISCAQRSGDGSYSDASLEQQYQSVLRQDHHARSALLASQLGAAASVVLFILDLRHARAPGDIPYHPPRTLQLAPGRDGDGVELRLHLPTR